MRSPVQLGHRDAGHGQGQRAYGEAARRSARRRRGEYHGAKDRHLRHGTHELQWLPLPAARQDGLQPDKTNTLRPKLEAMKAPPIKQRVKSQMSTSESACQVIDNGPVHMLSTVAWRVVEGHEVRGE